MDKGFGVGVIGFLSFAIAFSSFGIYAVDRDFWALILGVSCIIIYGLMLFFDDKLKKEEKYWCDICKCSVNCEHECGCDWMEYLYNNKIPKMNSPEEYEEWKVHK